jgi:hypothetical protein
VQELDFFGGKENGWKTVGVERVINKKGSFFVEDTSGLESL